MESENGRYFPGELFFKECPPTDRSTSPSKDAILCLDPIIINSDFGTFSDSFFKTSQVDTCLRSLLINSFIWGNSELETVSLSHLHSVWPWKNEGSSTNHLYTLGIREVPILCLVVPHKKNAGAQKLFH